MVKEFHIYMARKILFLFLFMLCLKPAMSMASPPPFCIEEEDASPKKCLYKSLKVTNGTLTNNGDGTVSLATGGGGGGTVDDDVTVNSTAVDTTANFLDGDIDWTLVDGGAGGPDDITATLDATYEASLDVNSATTAGTITGDLDPDQLSGDTTDDNLVDDAIIAASIARDSELHNAVTLAGTPDYITLSGQVLTRGTIDIGDDTNLAGTANEIVLTGDTLSLHADIARDSELHSAVTFAGTGTYISLAGQVITVDPITESDISDLTHTTDTNANTICTGTTTYLDGEGNCDTLTTFPGFTDLDTDYANETITSDFDFGGGVLQIPNSTSLPASCEVGDVYFDTDATTGQRFYGCESANTWKLQGDGSGGGSGSMTTTKESDTPVGDADIVTLDFGSGFDLAETPDTEVQITLDFTEVAGHDNFTDFVAAEHVSLPNTTAAVISDQNAGTDITADLEEEAHASEHAVGGADTVFPADPNADRFLMWDDAPTGEFIMKQLVEADISDLQSYLTAEANNLSAAVTWANVPDANVDGSNERDEVCNTTDLSSTCEINANVVDFADILYTNTLAGNPALGSDECFFISTATGGGFICEGSTADTSEQLYMFPDNNGADTTQTITLNDETQTLTNKTINTASNTITIVEADISDLSHTADEVGTLTTGDLCVNDGSAVNCTVNTEAELETALDALDVVTVTAGDITSANLITILSDETGSGSAVFGTSPTITSPTISTSIALPTGAVDTATEIANDIITHAQILDSDQADTKCFTYIEADGIDSDDDFVSIWANKTANNFDLTEIWCETDTGTVTMMLQVDDGTPADVDTVDLVCAATAVEDTSLNGDTQVAADEELDFAVTSTASTPVQVRVCFTGNWAD